MNGGPSAKDFYDRLLALRTSAGVSGRELSTVVSGNPSYLASGKSVGSMVGADRALALARALGTTVEYLVAGEGEAPSPEQVRAAFEAARAKVSAPAA